MRRSFNGRGTSRRAVVIAALLAFLVGGSGQAYQTVACPSHDGSHAGGPDRPELEGSKTGTSEHHGVEHDRGLHHGQGAADGGTRLDDGGSTPGHEGHLCTCVGSCCGSTAAQVSAPQGRARSLALSTSATLQPAASALPLAAESPYLLPFANAPPASI